MVPGTGLTLGQWKYGVSPLPTIPAPTSGLPALSIGRLMDPNYRNPVTEEFNGGYSWALNPNSVIEAEYTHVLGLHENKTINVDQRLPAGAGCCTAPLDGLKFPGSTSAQFASVRNEESIGRSHYDGFNFSFRQRMSHHFTVNANYTLAWANGYDSGGGSFRDYPRIASNPFASYEYGPSPNDERHHVTLSGLIDLPKGFQISPIMQFGSARPYNLTNSYNTLNAGGGTATAVLVPTNSITNFLYGPTYITAYQQAFAAHCTASPSDPICKSSPTTLAKQNLQVCFYLAQCAPSLGPALSPLTIAKYDPLRGDPYYELDMRLAKNIKIRERMSLQLVAQAFNLTNRANYGNNFGLNIGNAKTFGHPVGFINPASTIIPRAVWGEMGVRFTF
jgi:hypothetical protein